jgi:dsDNA-specific endonuclease/ATPase MutS2
MTEFSPEEPVRVPIEDVFDLHTIAPRDTRAAVEAYLEAAVEAGFRYVRVIHGRGIGVQRETVRAVLAASASVEHFADAPLEAGGWGATIVTLRAGDITRAGASGFGTMNNDD